MKRHRNISTRCAVINCAVMSCAVLAAACSGNSAPRPSSALAGWDHSYTPDFDAVYSLAATVAGGGGTSCTDLVAAVQQAQSDPPPPDTKLANDVAAFYAGALALAHACTSSESSFYSDAGALISEEISVNVDAKAVGITDLATD